MLEPEQTQILLAGVDEVGRGPLAGPVVAAAVILPDDYQLSGLNDSKKLSEKKRQQLAVAIKEQAVAWSLARMEWHEVDALNVLQASLVAMQKAVDGLSLQPDKVLVDGNQIPKMRFPVEAIVGGDSLVPAISAASILAKVVRDEEMIHLDTVYPGYGFARHKGYPTKQHLQALQELGITPIHRRSFAPVKNILKGGAC